MGWISEPRDDLDLVTGWMDGWFAGWLAGGIAFVAQVVYRGCG